LDVKELLHPMFEAFEITHQTMLADQIVMENELLRDLESRRTRPRVTWTEQPPWTLEENNDDENVIMFRFKREQIVRLVEVLRIPPVFRFGTRNKIDNITAFCVLLKRYAYPCRLNDLAEYFRRQIEFLSKLVNALTMFLYERFKVLLEFDYLRLTREKLEEFATAIARKTPLQCVFGFIDGTVRRICRPSAHQKNWYSGHKRYHGLKYQAITTPDGIIVHLYGPIEARRHDITMFRLSAIAQTIQRHAKDTTGEQLFIYGDPAYGLSPCTLCPYKHKRLEPLEREFNKQMSQSRVSVEYGFQRVVTYFPFIDYFKNQKIFLQPLGPQYIVCVLLSNLLGIMQQRTETSLKFDVAMPSLEEYLATAFLNFNFEQENIDDDNN